MPKPDFAAPDTSAAELAEIPRGATHDMIRELCRLGLTEETSRGILRVLMRSDVQTAALAFEEW